MPEWSQLKTLIARPDPSSYLDRAKGELDRYNKLMVGYYADAKSAAHKALESLWRNARDLFSAYTKAKTASEKDAIVQQMLQKLPADFWNYIGDMYRALGNYSNAKGRYEQLDKFLRWYTGESVAVSDADVELINQILGGVTG
jgi:tetratricopeptide (TPR) repeat protein